ncbi:hypothetical protein ISS04_02765 [Candidatus Woesearchaeota archaeon]|nr:hypothetical protein [Candidatus Woesearchaeota archaeon]
MTEKIEIPLSGRTNPRYDKIYVDTNIFLPPYNGPNLGNKFKCWKINDFKKSFELDYLSKRKILDYFDRYNLEYISALENLMMSDERFGIISGVKHELGNIKKGHNKRKQRINHSINKVFYRQAHQSFTKVFSGIYNIIDYLDYNKRITDQNETDKSKIYNILFGIVKKEKNREETMATKKNFTDERIIATAIYDSIDAKINVGIFTRDNGLKEALVYSNRKVKETFGVYPNVKSINLVYNHFLRLENEPVNYNKELIDSVVM